MSSLRQMRILKAIWFFSVHSCNNNNSLKIQSHVARVGFYITDVLQSRRKKNALTASSRRMRFFVLFFLYFQFHRYSWGRTKEKCCQVQIFRMNQTLFYSFHFKARLKYVSSSRGNWEYVEIRETRILQFVSKEVIFLFYRLLME